MGESKPAEYCGIGIRGVAMGIDSIIWIGLLFGAILITGAFTGQLETTTQGVDANLEGGPASIALGVWFVLSLGYHTILEWLFGKTIGKALVSIRVTNTSGSTPSLLASIIRNIVRLIDWIPALYLIGIVGIIISDRQQRLGDKLAGTVVVRD